MWNVCFVSFVFIVYVSKRLCAQSQEPIKIMCVGQSPFISDTKNIKCMLEKVENYSKAYKNNIVKLSNDVKGSLTVLKW